MTALEALNHARANGVSAAALHPLLALLEDSPLTPTELAIRTGTSTSNMTGLLDRLVHGGWVDRIHDISDRRKIRLTPTEKAFDKLSPLIPE
jgi:DNA-binding MarR family transcriptional regulator